MVGSLLIRRAESLNAKAGAVTVADQSTDAWAGSRPVRATFCTLGGSQ